MRPELERAARAIESANFARFSAPIMSVATRAIGAACCHPVRFLYSGPIHAGLHCVQRHLMRIEYVYIALAALTWGGYPLIARASGVAGPIGALILTLFSLAPISAMLIWQGGATRLSPMELIKLIVGGLLMGVGTTAFNFVANSRQMDASISIPIVDTMMLLITVIGAIVFFAEPVTVKKTVGIALLIAGIVVLKPE